MVNEQDRRGRSLGLATGFTVGVLWIAMAVAALVSAFQGLQNERPDWALGWGLVGGLLLAAGASALVGSWWHEFRVKRRE